MTLKRVHKNAHGLKLPSGTRYGQLNARAIRRFKSTEKHLLNDVHSLLDVGCFCGEWINFLLNKRKGIQEHLGIDAAQNKIDEANSRYPHLTLQMALAEDLDLPDASFDAVTCLEVLEHIPEWTSVLESLFRLADKQVIVTVPYKEARSYTSCVHCGELTPIHGHLRSYSEESFPEVPGWSRSFSKIVPRESARTLLCRSFLYNIYRAFKPSWLLVDYRKLP